MAVSAEIGCSKIWRDSCAAGALMIFVLSCGAQGGPTAPMRAMQTVGKGVEGKPYVGAAANAAAAATLQVATGCSIQGCRPGHVCDRQRNVCTEVETVPKIIPAGLPGATEPSPTSEPNEQHRCLGPVRQGVCPSDHVKAPGPVER